MHVAADKGRHAGTLIQCMHVRRCWTPCAGCLRYIIVLRWRLLPPGVFCTFDFECACGPAAAGPKLRASPSPSQRCTPDQGPHTSACKSLPARPARLTTPRGTRRLKQTATEARMENSSSWAPTAASASTTSYSPSKPKPAPASDKRVISAPQALRPVNKRATLCVVADDSKPAQADLLLFAPPAAVVLRVPGTLW